LILIYLSFSDLFRSSPFQICFTADLSLVYIFFSFASGGRQLGGDDAGFKLLLWPLQLVAEGNGVDLWAAVCWLLWLTVWIKHGSVVSVFSSVNLRSQSGHSL
jgi:hypothetical protein